MAREYPRFLFSNPKNTKSPGPFIVHCLEPRLIFRAENIVISPPFHETGEVSFTLVQLDPKSSDKDHRIKEDAWDWFAQQLIKREIIIDGIDL